MTNTRNPQQLLLVKQLYEDARTLAGREDDLSLVKGVILLDLAVEQILNVIVMDFTSLNAPKGKPGRKDIGWGDIWGRAAAAMKDKKHDLLNHGQLLSLHEVRNLAVHNGSVPSQGEIQRYIEPVEEMLTGVFRDGYSVDFQRFRLWDLVQMMACDNFSLIASVRLGRAIPPSVSLVVFRLIILSSVSFAILRAQGVSGLRKLRLGPASPTLLSHLE